MENEDQQEQQKKWYQRIADKLKIDFFKFFFIIFVGVFLVATVISTVVSLIFLKPKKMNAQPFNYKTLTSGASLTQVKKNVLDRNIFNASGKIPPEDEIDDDQGLVKNFDEIPCTESDTKLPFELLGILYTGNSKTNLATFKDPKVETADVYREGSKIIDNEAYSIFKIPNAYTVQLRIENKKICLTTGTHIRPTNNETNVAQNTEQSYELDSEYVNDQIGPGFSRILSSARLIPESSGGKTLGFKVFGISPGSLFDRLKIENGDIITQVNGVSLEDPSQGFKIYEALQDEANVTFQIRRSGTQLTKKVSIR